MHHLAQLNIARLLAPLTSPQLAGFVAALDPINALADRSPGFVWRLQTDDGDATALRPLDDESLIVNLTVWDSVEALSDFVFRSDHTDVMRRRRQWFEVMQEAYTVLWWVPAGHLPTVEEASARLEQLRSAGPTAEAFTLRQPYASPDRVAGQRQSVSPSFGEPAAEQGGALLL
jgi:hypothetical protein